MIPVDSCHSDLGICYASISPPLAVDVATLTSIAIVQLVDITDYDLNHIKWGVIGSCFHKEDKPE
jgi:hypothetical protein